MVGTQRAQIFSLQIENSELERRLSQQVPEDINITIRQNASLKGVIHSLELKITEFKKLNKASRKREREAERVREDLEESKRVIAELEERLGRRSTAPSPSRGFVDERQHTALIHRNSALLQDLDDARAALQDTEDEMQILRDALDEANQTHQISLRNSTSASNERVHIIELEHRVEELEQENAELADQVARASEEIEERGAAIAEREDTIHELDADLEKGNEEIVRLDRALQRAADERSESRAEVFEHWEEREEILNVRPPSILSSIDMLRI